MEWLRIAGEVAALAGVVYVAASAAIRVELRWHRADINRAHRRLDTHDERIRDLEVG